MRAPQGTEETIGAETPPGVRATDDRELSRGELVGRYVVLSKLGAGGMGVVYVAYDPELDRRVALKLLHAGEHAGSEGGARLLREAQALAKLANPNVVAVHDVGTVGARVWIAMELVAGHTLRQWLAARPRRWPEVLAVYLAAGRGLVAAHAQGVVHRDFKPDNVMLGDDGRVRVMDFGLARTAGPAEAEADAPADVSLEHDAAMPRSRRRLHEIVTRAGALAGTPAYMAPEQLQGAAADARSDQFALCVSLWEGLYGARPFGGHSLVELAASVLDGNVQATPRSARVPTWLRRVVMRGLSRDPSARWPDVTALLEVLQRGQSRARTRRVLAGVATVALACVAVVIGNEVEEQRRIAACQAEGAAIAEVWNERERAAVRASLLATGAGHAHATADRVMPWLDAQANAWAAARTESCVDANVLEVSDADLLDRSTWCLDERRFELAALVGALQNANTKVVTNAVAAAAGLRRIDACRDPILLQRLPVPPSEGRDAVQAVRETLARAGSLQVTGAYAQGLALAKEGLEDAKGSGWPPLVAAAQTRVAALLERTGAYEDAESMLESAYFEAARAGALEEALSAAEMLVDTVGYRLARPAEGERWSKHAAVLRMALPDVAGLGEAQSLARLAQVRRATRAYAEAAALHERALAIRERALGPEHPDVAASLNDLAAMRAATGAHAEMATLLGRAIAIREKTLGPEHPDVAQSLTNLANVRYLSGAYEEATSLHERALAIRENALGPDHADVAQSLTNLAAVRFATGAYADAAALSERALAVRERALGPEHPDVATSLANLAEARYVAGAHTEAATLYERSLAIREKALGPEHFGVADPLLGLARVALAQQRASDAVPLAERAVELRERGNVSATDVAEARFLLARSLRAADISIERALDLATRARDVYRKSGEAQRDKLENVEAFLHEHGSER